MDEEKQRVGMEVGQGVQDFSEVLYRRGGRGKK